MTTKMHRKAAPSSKPLLLTVAALGLGLATMSAPLPVWAQDKNVATPKTVNPNEEYNLPPNFDPNFKSKKRSGSTKVTVDFRQAQLEEVVKYFSSIMDKNFIIADTLQANKTITIITPKPVSLNEAYRAFLTALHMNGLTIVPMGSFLKIVEAKKAIQEPINPIDPDGYIPNDARVVTAMIPVESASVDEIQQIVQKFLTPDAQMIAYGNSLIITENAANLRRIRNMIKKLDKSSATNRVFVYKISYADATEIQDRLNEIFGVGGAQANSNAARTARTARRNTTTAATATVEQSGNEPLDVDITEIIADDRTNQLFIISDERSFNRIKQMIELLDVPTAVGGEIHVKSLEYANAEDLASTLSGLANSSRSTTSSSSRNNNRRTTNTRTAAPVNNASGGVAQLLQGDVQITAHKPTNSLIIIAAPRDYVALDKVVSILDRPRRQVYVEAVIMEIGLDVNRQLGLGLNGGSAADLSGVIPQSAVDDGIVNGTDGLILGQANFGSGFTSVLGGTGGAIGMIGPSINIPGVDISLPAFAMYLQATQTDNSVNVLSTPSIMTLDNEEAEIVVGDRVPIPRGGSGLGNISSLLGSSSATAGLGTSALGLLGGGLLGQIDYEDVGITLRILPQVNQSNYVRLEVDQEVSDIKGAGSQNSNLGPTRTKRSVKNVVLVKDQSTIVIGGLIRDVENETEEKVPFFGDVPLIGLLFKNKTTLKTKQNLVLMLTPYIIESEADLRKIYDRKKREREELLKLFLKRDINYMRSVNYDKKSGLLDRMRTQIGGAVKDQAAREEALKAFEDNSPKYRVLGDPAAEDTSTEPTKPQDTTPEGDSTNPLDDTQETPNE